MALRCAAGDETGEIFDGVLAMDPNLEEGTCYLTGMFSHLDPNNAGDLMGILRKVGEKCESVDEWILIHDHIVNCVDKLGTNISPMVQQCKEIAGPFASVQSDQASPFIQWFRQASTHAGRVRCVFADDPRKRAVIADMRLQHMENGCLGDVFTGDAFAFVSESRHIDFMRAECFHQHMYDFVSSF